MSLLLYVSTIFHNHKLSERATKHLSFIFRIFAVLIKHTFIMKKIGVLSDTHCFIPEQVYTFFEDCDELWHAGDIGNLETYNKLQDFKPVTAVFGNCDGYDLRYQISQNQLFNCAGAKVLMTHIGGYPGRYDPRARRLIESLRPQIFVCGHSHILKVIHDSHYDMLCINPGAAGIQGWHIVRTALRFRIAGGAVSDMEVFNLERRT